MLDNKEFDLWADGYDRSVQQSDHDNTYPFAGYKEVLNTIYKSVVEGNGKTVLDIGFGTGVLTKKLYENGIEITGIDFSVEMIKIAQKKMPLAKLIQYDFSKGIPKEVKNEKFDYIVCTYAIHHLNDTEKIEFIQKLRTLLNENGKILLGDVAFKTRKELSTCREISKEEWDDDEIYIVADEFLNHFPDMKFIKISNCSGVCMISRKKMQ